MIEGGRQLREVVFSFDHWFDPGSVDCANEVFEGPPMPYLDALDHQVLEGERSEAARNLEAIDHTDQRNSAEERRCFQRPRQMAAL